ncbi:golgin candidate 1 isoform X2 [Silene latifolia]|uniref:golgin candidate 1 isoform X2 n=1 Tax=Silene latifolia TaxID=37657 RepID=UPI003D7836FE
MASWLKRAEDLFEVVDRRAKLVVSELADEQDNIPPTAPNGTGSQGRKSKPKGKRGPKKEHVQDQRPAESSLLPLESDSIPDEVVASSTVEKHSLDPEISITQPTSEQVEKSESTSILDGALFDASSNELGKHDATKVEDSSNTTKRAPSVTNDDHNGEIDAPSPDVSSSVTSTLIGTELSLDNHHNAPGESISLKESDDSLKPGEEKSQSKFDETPNLVTDDSKMENIVDVARETVSIPTKTEDHKGNSNLNIVEEQLDEAQGLLKSTSSTGQSKEARLARVCAGLSSRLQEYKSENAQLEELLTAERELSKSCEDRIKKLQQDLSSAKREVGRVESNMTEALGAKNAEIETLVSSLEVLKKQAASYEGNMASLQANMESLMRNRELTETRMMQALREELALAERRAEEERAAHNATKKAAMEREVELEHRAVDASTALARIQRMADERAVKSSDLEQKVALLEVECATLNQELQDMEGRLRREQKKSPEDGTQLIQVQAWQQEVERARMGQTNAESKVSSLEAELQKMRVEMAAIKRDAEHYSRQEHMELEKRYRELTDLLYYKQTQLETMASEKAAAQFQLEKEVKRLQEAQAEAERNKISRRASSSWDEEADMKELEPLPLHQRHLAGASIQFRKAAKLLDSGAVSATRILWRHPRARVGLLCYLVFVHLFLMYLLHRLQAQADDFSAQEVAQSMGLSQPNLPRL